MNKLLIALVLLASSLNAFAGLVTFDNRTDFASDTGAVGIGALPNNGGSGNFIVGGFSFSGVGGSSLNTDRNWSTEISEANDLAINDVENFDFGSPGPIFAFGFDFHEPSVQGAPSPDTCNAPCIDSTFSVTLLSGATVIGSFTFNRPDGLQFVGVASSEAFDSVQIREIVGGIDNEFFGNFLVSRTRTVPEPSTLGLIGAGLLALGIFRCKPVR